MTPTPDVLSQTTELVDGQVHQRSRRPVGG